MTSAQRKKHLIIWSTLLVIIPIFFLLATKQKVSYLSQHKMSWTSVPLEWEVKSHRLIMDVYQPFQSPSALLYLVTDEKEIFLGEVTQRAHYKFSIPRKYKSIKIIDAFSKEILYESQ